MSFGELLILADEERQSIPEVSVEVPLDPFFDDFGFTDVDSVSPGLRIDTLKKIDAGLGRFLSFQYLFKL